MSQKGGIMDWYFQIYNIFRIMDVDCLPDDFMKYVDFSLHLPENLQILTNIWRNTNENLL